MNKTRSATRPVQASIGAVKQEDYGVIHCHLWLVGTLKGVHGWFNQVSTTGLSSLDLGTRTMQDVFHSTRIITRSTKKGEKTD